jgi:hypothetical protein
VVTAAWTLSINWLTEEGYGTRGFLTLYYFSGDGKGLKGCQPDIKLRLALSMLVLADPPADLVAKYFPQLAKLSLREQVGVCVCGSVCVQVCVYDYVRIKVCACM